MLSTIEINQSALRDNYRVFKQILGAEQVAPVLKSNAYGHGIKETYQILASENPAWLCANYFEEGALIRKLGFRGRLLICGPVLPQHLGMAESLDADFFLGDHTLLDTFLKHPKPLKAHLEFDTGMSRLGFKPAEAAAVLQKILPKKDQIKGICMHFANVEDVTEQAYAQKQMSEFEAACGVFSKAGVTFLRHASASASALLMDTARFDLCRVGISTYGLWPSQMTKVSYLQHTKQMIELKPALSWRSMIVQINPIKSGTYVGYGCTYKARHDMNVGVVPVGYFEGYPRVASNSGAYVLIKGERCPIVGRICMNMMMVDLDDLEDIQVGERVTLIGQDGKERIDAGDMASWSNTINYEIVSRLHPDIPRSLV